MRPALRDLAGLAPVIRQSQEGRDVTREHVTAKDRLQAARAERRSLLRRLEPRRRPTPRPRRSGAGSTWCSGEINGLRAQLRDLRLRTDYAVVTVTSPARRARQRRRERARSTTPFDDAGGLLVGLAGVLIRVLALGDPARPDRPARLAGARAALRRRRRESALA